MMVRTMSRAIDSATFRSDRFSLLSDVPLSIQLGRLPAARRCWPRNGPTKRRRTLHSACGCLCLGYRMPYVSWGEPVTDVMNSARVRLGELQPDARETPTALD